MPNDNKPFAITGMDQIFGQKKKQPDIDFGEIQGVARDLSRRVKVVEERIEQQRKTIQVNEQNMLSSSKRMDGEIKSFIVELNEIKSEIKEIKDQMSIIMNEVKASAKKEDVQVLEKYINLWEPIKFCTEEDVKSIVRRILKES